MHSGGVILGMNDSYQERFCRLFSSYRDKKIALYGTGNNARFITSHVKGFNFITYVDDRHIGENINNMPVVSLSEAIERADVLIIAATPASTSIVYNRIKVALPDDYQVFDMRGHRLNGADYYKENPYWEKSVNDLLDQIDRHEVISFDIFDTLLMRNCYKPGDVFELVEKKIKSAHDISFASVRIEAERLCSKGKLYPDLDTIYEKICELTDITSKESEEIKKWEIETEKQLVCLRREIYKVYKYAKEKGKKIYLTSDMYLNSDILRKLLRHCGYEYDDDVLVSCEQGTDKVSGGLYRILKKREPDRKILHIGDNIDADIDPANREGIDSFWVMSGRDMLACSSGAYICDSITTLEDKICAGLLCSVFFNDPFSLHMSKGKIELRDYTYFAGVFFPITLACLRLIFENSQSFDFILFPSRDGFFVHELYERYKARFCEEAVPSAYFYASRTAVSSASALDEASIKTFSNKLYEDEKRDAKQFMRSQFGLDVCETGEWADKKNHEIPFLYKDTIIRNAEKNREKYLSYLKENVGAEKYGKMCIFDVITQGTLVYGLEKILDKKMGCITMATTSMPNEYVNDMDDVYSLYGNVNEKIDGKVFSLNDFSVLEQLLEIVYASKDGQFAGFDDGNRVLTVAGSEYNAELLEKVQAGIDEFIREYMEIAGKYIEVSSEFALQILRLIYPSNSILAKDIYTAMTFHDPYRDEGEFFNLMDQIC